MEVTDEHGDRTEQDGVAGAGDGAGTTPEGSASELYDAARPPFEDRPAPPPAADRGLAGPVPAPGAAPRVPRPAVAAAAVVALVLLLLRRRRRRP